MDSREFWFHIFMMLVGLGGAVYSQFVTHNQDAAAWACALAGLAFVAARKTYQRSKSTSPINARHGA